MFLPRIPATLPFNTSALHPLVLLAFQANSTETPAVEVVCAWAVSGQYGPGARMLYYALVIVAVFARRNEWIKEACLAAALLFPAVAAIHALILAADSTLGRPFYSVPYAIFYKSKISPLFWFDV